MTTEVFDVAVVGAGPAGSTFARFLALSKPEARIAIIDGQTRERSKVCGGLLSPDAQKVLASFDMTLPKEVLADPQIFAVETIDIPRRHVRYYQRNYLNMDRYAFDSWLLSLVPKSVSVISARCRSVERGKDGFFSLSVGEQTIEARAIVGADGASSIVRKSFFDKPIKKYVAIQQHFKNDGQRVPFYSCIFDPATSDSCSWSIHKDGYIIFGGAFEQSLCRDAFEKQKARFQEMLGNDLGAPLKTEACLVCSPRHLHDLCIGKEGVYLIGEAAGFISSSSFEGISSALLSGKLLADAFACSDSHSAILRKYRKNTLALRLKLYGKTFKRSILCSPTLRHCIMRSGIMSVKKYEKN